MSMVVSMFRFYGYYYFTRSLQLLIQYFFTSTATIYILSIGLDIVVFVYFNTIQYNTIPFQLCSLFFFSLSFSLFRVFVIVVVERTRDLYDVSIIISIITILSYTYNCILTWSRIGVEEQQ